MVDHIFFDIFRSWISDVYLNERIPLEKIREILEIYREMEILLKYFHEMYCTLIMPFAKYILMSFTVLCSYGVLRTDGILAGFLFILGIFSFVFLSTLIGLQAEIHTISTEIRTLMKSPRFQNSLIHTGALYERKIVKSLPLLQIKMFSSYVLDKPNVKTVLKIVVDTTIDFLLTNP